MGTHPIFESDFDCLTDAFRRYSRGRSKILRTKTSKINSFITAICGEMEVRSLLRVDHTFFIFLFRLILLLMTVLPILFTWLWLNDPNSSNTTLYTSLKAHPFFLLSCSMLIISFVFGIHQRVVAPSILVQRIRLVLEDYGMSISQTGDLIIRR